MTNVGDAHTDYDRQAGDDHNAGDDRHAGDDRYASDDYHAGDDNVRLSLFIYLLNNHKTVPLNLLPRLTGLINL